MVCHLPGDPFWSDPEGKYLDSVTPPSRLLRIGFTTSADTDVDREVEDCVRAVVATLEGLGHELDEHGPETSAFTARFWS